MKKNRELDHDFKTPLIAASIPISIVGAALIYYLTNII